MSPTGSTSASAMRSRRIESLAGPFDLVFIDAWKNDYIDYYEAVLPKLADDGVILADNTLCGDSAGNKGISALQRARARTTIASSACSLPIRDGVTLIPTPAVSSPSEPSTTSA